MFTGIVEELGEVVALDDAGDREDHVRLTVRGPLVTADSAPGDSIAVNGVCLTVVECADGHFSADAMRETLARSSLGRLVAGSRVNLERAARLGGRLGGHLVQGHVDATATVLSRVRGEHWQVVRVALPDELARYVVPKGSVTVDGVSLTVSDLGPGWFEVSLVPATLAATTLGTAGVGTTVNLEVDVVGKYVESLLAARGGAS